MFCILLGLCLDLTFLFYFCTVGTLDEAQCIFQMLNTLHYLSERSNNRPRMEIVQNLTRHPRQSFSNTTGASFSTRKTHLRESQAPAISILKHAK